MKIIQLNIEFGYRLPQILDFISAEQPDLMCCQEVLSTNKTIPLSPLMDSLQSLERIKKAGGFNHHFFAPTWGAGIFGIRMEMGNAIFSKFPLQNPQIIFISKAYKTTQTVDDYNSNIRNLQICSVLLGGSSKKLTIANHHGYIVPKSHLGNKGTLKFTQKLADNLRMFTGSLILCSDLNITKESPAFAPIARLGLRNLTAEHHIKTTLSEVHRAPNKDSVACDYILCSDNIKVNRFSVSNKIVSDHRALILEFDI